MGDEYFTIKTSYAHYHAVIVHQYSGSMDKVYIGSKKRCVLFSIYLDGDHPNIDAIGFNENCNLAGDLKRGYGTMHMIRCALSFIHNKYPQLKNLPFELKDVSSISCGRFDLPLSKYYLSKYGKTWYEMKFGAIPASHSLLLKYNRARDALLRYLHQSPILPFTDFIQQFNSKTQRLLTALRSTYDTSKSLHDFIIKLDSEYDCAIFERWLEVLVDPFIQVYGTTWHISFDASSQPIIIETLKKKPEYLFTMAGGYINRFVG